MSNNRSPPSPSKFPFLVVEYEDNAAIVGRETNYKELLGSIKKRFSALRNTSDEDIQICAHIEDIDRTCRIADEIWSELLPRLTVVQVAVDRPVQSGKLEEVSSEPTKSEEQAKSEATIHVHRRLWGDWNYPVFHICTTWISLDHTFAQLAEQIKREENIKATQSQFRYGRAARDASSSLVSQGVRSNSLVEVMLQ